MSITIIASIYAKEDGRIPEPKIRPDISVNAKWDDKLGMYISDDYIKDENGEYIINIDKFTEHDPDTLFSPEQEWLKKRGDSKDLIDMAILKTVELSSAEPPSLSWILSAIGPHDQKFMVDTMSELDICLLPTIWERTCTEVAFRSQKLLAMELLLGIRWDYGLYDSFAQKLWYECFIETQKEIIEATDVNNITRHGILALPKLVNEYKSGNRQSIEAIHTVMDSNSTLVYLNRSDADGKINVDTWIRDNEDIIIVLNEVLLSNHIWAE